MSISDEKQKEWYDALLAGTKMAQKVNAEVFGALAGASYDAILECGEKIAVSMMIEATGGRRGSSGGGTFQKGPKGQPTDYKCPQCGSAVVDERQTRTNANAPDFKCTSCKNDKGYYTGFWLTDKKTGYTKSPDEVFGAAAGSLTNEAVSAGPDVGGEGSLPF